MSICDSNIGNDSDGNDVLDGTDVAIVGSGVRIAFVICVLFAYYFSSLR